MSEPEKKYVLLTERRERLQLQCYVQPKTLSFLKSLALTRESGLGYAIDWLVKDYLATRELHERIKENKKSLQSLKKDGRSMSHE